MSATGLIALAWRAPWLVQATRTLDGDEAVTGIMALDILDGTRPLYYYGQGYLGTLEPFTAAGLFGLLGPSAAVLRLAPLLLWVLSLGLQYLVVRHWFGRTAAVASVLTWCVAPAAVALWTVKARGGFTAVLLFGMALTWVYQRATAASPTVRRRWLLAGGVLLGLGWWTNAMVVYYLVPLAILAGRRVAAAERGARLNVTGPKAGTGRQHRAQGLTARQWLGGLVPFAIGLGVGLIPVVIYRLGPAGLTSRQLFDPTAAAWVAGVSRLGGEVLPLLFGLGQSALGVAAAVLLTGAAVLSIRSAARAVRLSRDPDRAARQLGESDGRLYVALVWLTVPAVALFSNQVIDVHGFRYLLPLYTAVSISLSAMFAAAVRSGSWRRPIGVALAVVWVAHCAVSLGAHRDDALPDLPADDLARAAATMDVAAVTGPYWECHRLSFLTGRRLACVPCGGPVRDSRALQRWRRQQDFAAVVPNYDVEALLARTEAGPTADRVETVPIESWTLVVVRPGPAAGWRQRKAALLAHLAQLEARRPGAFAGWPALR